MAEKFKVYFLVISLFIFTASCTSLKMLDVKDFRLKSSKKIQVLGIVTMAGKWIEFTGKDKAGIIDGFVVGETESGEGESKIVRIPLAAVLKVWVKKPEVLKSTLRTIGVTASVFTGVLVTAFALSGFPE